MPHTLPTLFLKYFNFWGYKNVLFDNFYYNKSKDENNEFYSK